MDRRRRSIGRPEPLRLVLLASLQPRVRGRPAPAYSLTNRRHGAGGGGERMKRGLVSSRVIDIGGFSRGLERVGEDLTTT